ncbi:MAG: sugar kinase [Chloroflexi bacterium]|nr:sugar kinase [Chloroflexota bacterium]
MSQPQAIVVGRLVTDLYPLQSEVPLEQVRTFERFTGGYGGNVGIGLARLGVPTAVVSGVGDDGHGRAIVRDLEAEGVDTRWVSVHPNLRTALAFCELWPPDHFPLLPYRFPSCPDQEITPDDLPPADVLRGAPIVYVSGTAFAQRPSRSTAFAALEARRGVDAVAVAVATILDLDWRPGYWTQPEPYPDLMRQASGLADTVIGSDSEFAAAGLVPAEVAAAGARRVFVKHGPAGATLLENGRSHDEPGVPVPVVNGLGAGDAFAAAIGAGMLRGLPADRLLQVANAAGAIVATRLSCSSAMPTWTEVESMADDPTAWP